MKKVIKYILMINIYLLAFILWTHSALSKSNKTQNQRTEKRLKD
ncbi:MAG: hypothetical protein ACPGLV_01265 [Bacteroidia bacterium]